VGEVVNSTSINIWEL